MDLWSSLNFQMQQDFWGSVDCTYKNKLYHYFYLPLISSVIQCILFYAFLKKYSEKGSMAQKVKNLWTRGNKDPSTATLPRTISPLATLVSGHLVLESGSAQGHFFPQGFRTWAVRCRSIRLQWPGLIKVPLHCFQGQPGLILSF